MGDYFDVRVKRFKELLDGFNFGLTDSFLSVEKLPVKICDFDFIVVADANPSCPTNASLLPVESCVS
jgi:hypothetical protein